MSSSTAAPRDWTRPDWFSEAKLKDANGTRTIKRLTDLRKCAETELHRLDAGCERREKEFVMLYECEGTAKRPYTDDQEKSRLLQREQDRFVELQIDEGELDDDMEEKAPTKEGELKEAREIVGSINDEKAQIMKVEQRINTLRLSEVSSAIA